ncbi:hemin ABC transporter substrate-binding protein, partial [Stenotrophomonas sp. HMWF003]
MMKTRSSLRLLPLAMAVALAACSGPATPPAADAPAATAPAAESSAADALPAGWTRLDGGALPSLVGQAAVLPAKVRSDDGAEVEVDDT